LPLLISSNPNTVLADIARTAHMPLESGEADRFRENGVIPSREEKPLLSRTGGAMGRAEQLQAGNIDGTHAAHVYLHRAGLIQGFKQGTSEFSGKGYGQVTPDTEDVPLTRIPSVLSFNRQSAHDIS
jgi:hypothetical protein